jgi:hypothetical protein
MKLIFCVKIEEPLIPQGFIDIEKERKLQYLWYHSFVRLWCGQQDSICIFARGAKIMVLPPSSRRQATVHRTVAFRWVRVLYYLPTKKREAKPPSFSLVRMTGLDLHFCPWGKNYGVAAVQPAASDSPPDCRI